METFPIVKRKDEAAHGEYRTKRVILEMYDQMAALPKINVPAPKDPSQPYAVPDVSQFQTWLNPPPADPSVAHPEREGFSVDDNQITRREDWPADWELQPLPEQHVTLPVGKTYTAAEMDRIRRGVMPRSQDDRWFIVFEDGTLCHDRV